MFFLKQETEDELFGSVGFRTLSLVWPSVVQVPSVKHRRTKSEPFSFTSSRLVPLTAVRLKPRQRRQKPFSRLKVDGRHFGGKDATT